MGRYLSIQPGVRRQIFSDNLRKLVQKKGSNVSQIAREMKVNRTQLNRYVSGESWPSGADVLARICDYFDVGCEILLEPLPVGEPESEFRPAPLDDGRTFIKDREYLTDGKGALVPIEMVKAQDLREDATVRKICGFAIALSGQVSRFKEHTFDDVGALDAELEALYGVSKGGARGNKTLYSYDQLFKVEVRIADFIDFGPELQIAKSLTDEYFNSLTEDASPELRYVVTQAFNTDKKNQINRSEIYRLLRWDIDNDLWRRAMDAIRDAMRVVGSKTYIRSYRRESFDKPWLAVTIDLAKA